MIQSTKLISLSILILLSLFAILAVLNPFVVGAFFELDRDQIIYVSIFDIILLVFGILLLAYVKTGRTSYFVLSVIGFFSLPLIFAIWEMADSYFRIINIEAKYQQNQAIESNRLFESHSRLGWIHPGNATILDPNFNVVYQTDQNGRKNIPQTAGMRPTLRFYGDSFTFGYGVSNDDTALNLVTEKINSEFNILNYAVVGSGLEQMFIRFRSTLDQVKPGDVIIFSPLAEDLKRNLAFGKAYVCNHIATYGVGIERFPVLRSDGAWEFPDIWSECGILQTLLFHSRYPIGKLYKLIHEEYVATFRQDALLKNADVIFSQAKVLADKADASFLILFLVRPEECALGSFSLDISRLNSPFLSLMPYCPDGAVNTRNLQYSDGHWNVEGNRWAAQWIEQLLRTRLSNNR